MNRRPVCAICHHTIAPAILADGYSTHPSCDPDGEHRC